MSSSVAVGRMASIQISFAAFGLHFKAAGRRPAAAEEIVCKLGPAQVARVHIALTKRADPKRPQFSPLEWAALVALERRLSKVGATLEAQ